tara:strand:- start:4408 stop:4659 length:252 start_codon:yes stop_codon:yes gene_type:complete
MTQDHTELAKTILIDARGLNCPLPVLKLRKMLKGLRPGTDVELLATDRAALRDVPAFCRAHGYSVQVFDEPESLRFCIGKVDG